MTETPDEHSSRALRAASASEKLAGRSVVLVGMMGAGKTSIGRRLAAALNLPFIDADVEIESAAGMTISEIFARHGEAEFRAGERRVIARILGEKQVLLATGGGAWMNAATRERIAAHGVSVWLKADVDVLLQRVRKRANRPLLQSQDPEQTLRQLTSDRYPVYALADFCVVSRDGPHGLMVDLVLEALDEGLPGLRRQPAGPPAAAPPATASAAKPSTGAPLVVPVEAGGHRHEIHVEDGLLTRAGAEIARIAPGAGCVIVTDANVARHCLPRLEASLAAAGIRHARVLVEPGEGSKSFAVFSRLCEDILAARKGRDDAVVALGGGVVQDLAGFAAATIRPGLRLVQIPTTLVAQVKSTIGGEARIHARQGRNLVGARHPPVLALVDPRTLQSLPERAFRAGYAEIAQHALGGDAAFFDWLERSWRDIFARGPELAEAIARSCAAGAARLARNAGGERSLPNPGQPFGDALEAITRYDEARLAHGEAVAIGVACAFRFSARLGHCAREEAARVAAHLRAVGLPARFRDIPGWNAGADAILAAVTRDSGNGRVVPAVTLARGVGACFVAGDMPVSSVQAFLREELGY